MERCAACAGFVRRPPSKYPPPAAKRRRTASAPASAGQTLFLGAGISRLIAAVADGVGFASAG